MAPSEIELVPASVVVVQLLFSMSDRTVCTPPLALEDDDAPVAPEALALATPLVDVPLEPALDKPRSTPSAASARAVVEVLPVEALPELLALPPTLRLKASAGMLRISAGLNASNATAAERMSLLVMLISKISLR